MTPLRDVVLWRLVPFPGQLPPIVNAGPRAALGDLRRAEEASLQRLQHTPHIISEQQDEDISVMPLLILIVHYLLATLLHIRRVLRDIICN